MSVDVSADGEVLVFDLLGDLYLLPIAGGDALPLTTGRAWDRAPLFSPDGTSVYFVSDRAGHNSIWQVVLADTSLRRVTQPGAEVRGGPNWSGARGHLIVGIGDVRRGSNSEVILQAIDLVSGDAVSINRPEGSWVDWDAFKVLRERLMIFSGVQAADGQVYFSEGKFDEESRRVIVRLYSFDPVTQTRVAITPSDARRSEYKPQLSHDGRLLAYFRQYDNRRTEIRIRNRDTGKDEALVELIDADDALYSLNDDSRPNYAFTPDDRAIVYSHAGKINRVNLEDGSIDIVPFRVTVKREVWNRAKPSLQHIRADGEATVIRWPNVSRDGQTMVFAAIGYIWAMDLQTGRLRRLTDSSDFEYMPALSPSGEAVAYVSFAQVGIGYGPGRLMVVDVNEGGTPRELLAQANENYLLPQWAPDSERIAVIREVEDGSGLDATFGWTAVKDSEFQEVAAAPASDEVASLHIYARFVGFDMTGRSLLISYPLSRTKTVLSRVSLDGDIQSTLAAGSSEVGGITPAPDLSHVALTRDDGSVWIAPFVVGEDPSVVSTLAPEAVRISNGGGYYVDWNRPTQLTFAFAQNVYWYRLDDCELTSLRVKVGYQKPQARRPIAFKGARLVTLANDLGAGPVIESGTLVIEGARIAAIGPVGDVVIPANASVIDAAGKTIMPGLLDTHYHRIGGSGGLIGVSAFKLPNPKFSDRSAIKYGLTSAWEPGGPQSDAVPATADLQAAGRIAGPRWSHAASGTIGYPWELLSDYDAALAAVQQARELGADVLKEYDTPTREQRQWLSAAAHESDVGIVSHIETFDGMMTRIVDGYTGGDHPYIPIPFFKDVTELLRQTGYIWTPHITITPGTAGAGQPKKAEFCRAVLAWRSRNNVGRRRVEPICPTEYGRPIIPNDTHRFSRVARQAASAVSNGVSLGVSAHSTPGSGLYWEMWSLWKGGLAIEDVIRATTIGNAGKLGLQGEIGTLERGKIADLLVLEANPLDDILNVLTLEYTVQGGVVYDSDTAEPADLDSLPASDVALLQQSGSDGGS